MAGPGGARIGADWNCGQGGARRGLDWLVPDWLGGHGMERRGEAMQGRIFSDEKDRQMKPDEVKALREESDLSVAESARCVQISGRSWQRYESGERKVPEGIVELFCIKNGLKYPRD